MMDTTESDNVFGHLVKLLQPCSDFLLRLHTSHSVHPLEPPASHHSEYLILDAATKLRIINVKPTNAVSNHHHHHLHANAIDKRRSRNSLSEEYWFTRWNKPLQIGNCNCSFRHSKPYGKLDEYNKLEPAIQKQPVAVAESPLNGLNINASMKINNVDTFVERLIQDTLLEAFQDYCIGVAAQRGVANLSFQPDELDGVVLRAQPKPCQIDEAAVLQISEAIHAGDAQIVHTNARSNCVHNVIKSAKKKPIVILLHGIGVSADIWWNVIDTLRCREFEVVAPDMLGHGFSSAPDKPRAYKFQNLLKHVLDIFDHYVGTDESKKSIVIGHSYGCSLATALCRYRAQQIVQLILISGGGPTPLAPPIDGRDSSYVNCLQTLITPLLFCGVKRDILYSLRGKHFDVCDTANAIPNYVLRFICEGQNWPEGDAAFHRRILIPTLLVHGVQDTKVTLVQECEMERTIPRAFLELIPNAGHMSMLETPERLNHMIMCFIDWWSR